MGDTTEIAWATATFNPVIGCQKVSPACTHCYAETYAAQRLGRSELWRGERHITSAHTWNTPERVDRKAGRDGVRARLFVASLSDVFEDHPAWDGVCPHPPSVRSADGGVTLGWSVRTTVFRKLESLVHTDVLLLTKRPENILRMVPAAWLNAWPAHVWAGTTVEDQQRADERIPHLLAVPARVRFLSVEPMLGPVRLDANIGWELALSWVIAGAESGPNARPSSLWNARALRDQCARGGVPFFWKQWGEWGPANGHDFDAGRYPAVMVDGHPMVRVGKLAAGSLLDGVNHKAFPT